MVRYYICCSSSYGTFSKGYQTLLMIRIEPSPIRYLGLTQSPNCIFPAMTESFQKPQSSEMSMGGVELIPTSLQSSLSLSSAKAKFLSKVSTS